MKALNVHGGGALLASISCSVGASAAMEHGRELDDILKTQPSRVEVLGLVIGEALLGLGEGLR